MNSIKIATFGNEFFDFDPNQFTNNSSEYVVKGSKFINPTKSNSINKPVIGCGIYSEGQLVAENVQMSRMEIAYIYKDYISVGKKYNIYCTKEGYFPQAYTDIYMSTVIGKKINKNYFYYTDKYLYLSLNDGILGTNISNHNSGIEKNGEVNMLFLSNIAEFKVVLAE